jgi:dCTP deaminase
MLLSNTAIWEALDDGRLIISPEPWPRVENEGFKSPYDATGVNLTLGNVIRIPHDNISVAMDASAGDISKTLDLLCDFKELRDGDPHVLQPNNFILANTKEEVSLPKTRQQEWGDKPLLAARVEGKSSFARLGILIHFTAPTIHAGYRGNITLEIICLGKTPVLLKPGMQICQLLIETVCGDPQGYISKFHGQNDPVGKRS